MELLTLGLGLVLCIALGVTFGVFFAGILVLLAMSTKKGAKWLAKKGSQYVKLMLDSGENWLMM